MTKPKHWPKRDFTRKEGGFFNVGSVVGWMAWGKARDWCDEHGHTGTDGGCKKCGTYWLLDAEGAE